MTVDQRPFMRPDIFWTHFYFVFVLQQWKHMESNSNIIFNEFLLCKEKTNKKLFVPSSPYNLSKLSGLRALIASNIPTIAPTVWAKLYMMTSQVCRRRTLGSNPAIQENEWEKMKMWTCCMAKVVVGLTWVGETSTSWILLAWISYIHQISDTLTCER